jgi:hypothetical protein
MNTLSVQALKRHLSSWHICRSICFLLVALFVSTAAAADVLYGQSACNNVVSTVTGNPTTDFGLVYDVVVDAAGNRFIADRSNGRIVKVAPNGTQTVIATSLGELTGIAMGADGALYVTGYSSGEVKKVLQNGTTTVIASGFYQPVGIVVDSMGNIFFCDQLGYGSINRIAPDGTVSVFVSGLGSALPLTIDNADNLYVGDYYHNRIIKVTPSGTQTVLTTSANGPNGLAFDNATGILYFSDMNINTIKRLLPSGAIEVVAGSGVAGHINGRGAVATFNYPVHLRFVAPNILYVAEYGNQALRKIEIGVAGIGNLQSFTPTSAIEGTTVTLRGNGFAGATAVNFGGSPAQSFMVDGDTTITAIVGTGASGDVTVTTPCGVLSKSMFTFGLPDPPPSSPNILSFTPTVATTGTVVTISGFGFTGIQNVLFGGAPASAFTVVADSIITATVDYGASGDVSVVKSTGLATLPSFTYVPRPTISAFTPNNGNTGQVVTITGTNFMGTALDGTTWTTSSVYFGGVEASSFTVLSPTQIQATVGAGESGTVRVETLPGNVGTRSGFCYMAPSISAFAPTSASTGTQVVITGTNFTGTTQVRFNGVNAASFTVVSDSEIRAFPATNTALTGSIAVTNPNCTGSLATFTFIPAPVIYGFWLSGGTNGDVITIDGINFDGATAVKFADTVAASFTLVSPTRITAVVGNGKTGAVTVQSPGGAGSRSKFIYYAPGAGRPNPPVITSFTPTSGPDGTVVTINGLNFQGTDWFTTAVRIGDAPDGPRTAIIQSMTATRLVVKVNGGATGKIRVYTPAGVTTSTQSFNFLPPPTITSFTPSSGAAGTVVTITGTNFTGDGYTATALRFGSTNAASFTVNSATQITATVAAGTTGRITVVTQGGTAQSATNFTFPTPPPAPTVTSFSPAVATTGTVVTIRGTNFTGAGYTTTAVSFGSAAASTFTVVNSTTIRATVAAGASGVVSVTTSAGAANKAGFTYLPNPLPTITSFAPASASVGQTVTILGTYFTGATQVYMGSASVPFTVHHSGRITVVVPANAASGVIQVVTPNGVAARPGFSVIPTVLLSKNSTAGEFASEAAATAKAARTAQIASATAISLMVYPNPATETLTVEIPDLRATSANTAALQITVTNLLGERVMNIVESASQQNNQAIMLDIRSLSQGTYLLQVQQGGSRSIARFIKQ